MRLVGACVWIGFVVVISAALSFASYQVRKAKDAPNVENRKMAAGCRDYEAGHHGGEK